jgi:hypothetical protein
MSDDPQKYPLLGLSSIPPMATANALIRLAKWRCAKGRIHVAAMREELRRAAKELRASGTSGEVPARGAD